MPVPRPTGSYAPHSGSSLLLGGEGEVLGEGGLTYAQLHGRRGSEGEDGDGSGGYCRWEDCRQ